jgi:pimeloyl-ACP methyl ester carboxylesterase
VHGAASDLRTWDRQRAALAAHYRTIAFTQRYYGTAPWPADWPQYRIGTHADDLAAFIRGLGAGPAHLVAWSSGSHIVLNVALRNPELVRSVFVYEPVVPSYVDDPAELKAIGDDAGAMLGSAFSTAQARRVRRFGIVDDFFAIMVTNVYASECGRPPRLDHHGWNALNRNGLSVADDPRFRPFFSAFRGLCRRW